MVRQRIQIPAASTQSAAASECSNSTREMSLTIVPSRAHAYYPPAIHRSNSLNCAVRTVHSVENPRKNGCQAPATTNHLRFNNIHLPINFTGFTREVVVLLTVTRHGASPDTKYPSISFHSKTLRPLVRGDPFPQSKGQPRRAAPFLTQVQFSACAEAADEPGTASSSSSARRPRRRSS